jgi:outer membrane autotransporter protein
VGKTKTSWENGAQSDTEDLTGSLFARYDREDCYLSLEGFLGQSKANSKRYPGLGLLATSDSKVDWQGLKLIFAKLFNLETVRLTPRLGATFSKIHFSGVTEKGADTLNLTIAPSGTDSLELEGGLMIAKDINFGVSSMTPRLNLGIAYETLDTSLRLETKFAHNEAIPGFISEAPKSGRVRGIVELGVDFAIKENISITLDYRGSFRRKEKIHSGTLGFAINF